MKDLHDRILIRELMSAYADAVFRRDVEAYLACWDEQGIRIGQGAEVKGHEDLRLQWGQFWTVIESMAFFTEAAAIEVAGDQASARCYTREIIRLKGGSLWKVAGVYHDQLVRRNDEWRFSMRSYELLIDESQAAAGSS